MLKYSDSLKDNEEVAKDFKDLKNARMHGIQEHCDENCRLTIHCDTQWNVYEDTQKCQKTLTAMGRLRNLFRIFEEPWIERITVPNEEEE